MRAFLPLTLASDGALSKEDVRAVQTGKAVLLRKASKGEGTLFIDRTRALPNSTLESKLRALFYMVHHLSLEGEASQSLDCHVLVLLITPRTAPLDLNFIRGALTTFRLTPARCKVRLLLCMPKSGNTPWIQSVMAAGLSFASTNMDGLEVHTKPVGPPILAELSFLGLSSADFPASIGGTWKYENHRLWCRDRLAEDEKRTTLPKIPSKDNEKKPTEGAAENKRKTTKELNVILSRQKRERRKAELEDLQLSCKTLSEEQVCLRAENARLDGLLLSARDLVTRIESSAFQDALSGGSSMAQIFSILPSRGFQYGVYHILCTSRFSYPGVWEYHRVDPKSTT